MSADISDCFCETYKILACKEFYLLILVIFLLCISFNRYLTEEDGWVHKPGLIHLSMVCSSGPLCGAMCALSIANSTLLNLTVVSVLILFYFILFSNVCVL